MTRYVLVQSSASSIPLADESVQCVVTSPPFWGLRQYAGEQREVWGGDADCAHEWRAPRLISVGRNDTDAQTLARRAAAYGTGAGSGNIPPKATAEGDSWCACGAWYGALGLEPTPELYVEHMVAIFREVRRVLRKDGTLWLNLGDSYASTTSGTGARGGSFAGERSQWQGEAQRVQIPPGLKPKDLVGIPWAVATALRAPYYTGRIRNEHDRIWLAAMLDAEGCLFIHRRKAGQNAGQGYERKTDTYSPALEISNTSAAIMDRISTIVGKGSVASQGPEQNGRRRQTIYRWSLRSNEARELVRELYPYLVGKQHQARIFLGCPTNGEPAAAAHIALMGLHRGSATEVDYPEPSPMYEPGWYLRSDCIWSKPNPMPESVTDRPTKSHEYLFLLSKRERYFYDADAIREPVQQSSLDRVAQNGGNPKFEAARERRENGHITGRDTLRPDQLVPANGRNKRTVWTIATRPYPGAHFATYPEQLVEPCILAGTSPKACGVCGAPWERVTEREADERTPYKTEGAGTKADGAGRNDGKGIHKVLRDDGRGGDLATIKRTTLGWRSTCSHEDGSGSCVVLDPFNGSGTTGRVAMRHGRSYVGLDISREYLDEQAIRRIDPLAAAARDASAGRSEQGVLFT